MEEQIYILKNQDSFELNHIFECGQCFRWNKQEDGSYTGVFNNNILNVKKQDSDIIFKGICTNIEEIVYNYFDLQRDYEDIKYTLSKVDDDLKKSIEYGSGIRILNQDLWETIISFVISANNNIPRIKKIIEKISLNYGKKIIWNNQEFYTFPTPEELSKASLENLRNMGLGFRDKYIYEITKRVASKEFNLENLRKIDDVEKLRQELMSLPGIGEKVADCVMLFSDLKRVEVFPIDVWVRRVMNDLYIKNEDEKKVDKKQIRDLAQQKYKNLAGIAQQYLFYWKREA